MMRHIMVPYGSLSLTRYRTVLDRIVERVAKARATLNMVVISTAVYVDSLKIRGRVLVLVGRPPYPC